MASWGLPPRQESQVLTSPEVVNSDFQAAQNAYNSLMAALQWQAQNIQTPDQYASSQATQHANSGAFDQFFKDQAAINPVWNTQAQQDWYKAEYARDVAPTLLTGGSDPWSAQYIKGYDGLNSVQSYDPKAVASNIAGQQFAATEEFQKKRAEFEAFTANQTRQQQAFKQQTGGGFTGGLIDETYNNPFSNQIMGARSVGGLGGLGGMAMDPSMPNVAMPWAQPWGTPGFGQPGQGTSQGVGAYSPNGTGGNQQQQGGWGGVFGQNNPWSYA